LAPELTISTLEDGKGRAFNYFRHDSDYVNSDITVTGPADQVLLAAGQQVSEKIVGNRKIARFRSETPIFNFFSVQAAKYAVRKDNWKDVKVEVYYHPAHAFNVDRFMKLAKESIAYYSTNFSPYQFKQFRIVEFPAYNNFAQAFPGTVPYSEAAGFITKVDEAGGIDFIAYATAHEIGHQWWGHQVNGGDMQGSTVLTETLAQYSAIMVMEKRYGHAMIRRFLKAGAEGYLRQRGKENVAEPTLERVEDQAYVRYQKGGVAMYLLRDRMGEDAVNRALRKLIQQYGLKGPPYATSRDLIAALRAEAKPEHQQLITDLFQHITLYDLKVNDAQTSRRQDGKWTVTMEVEAHKRYADGKGVETEVPLDEMFDIGVFSSDPAAKSFRDAGVVMVQTQRVRSGRHRITLVVTREPKFVGLDPYLKYIDRDGQDNIHAVLRR
jgi:aminopeptidase N